MQSYSQHSSDVMRSSASIALVAPFQSMTGPVALSFEGRSPVRAKTRISAPLDSETTVTLLLTHTKEKMPTDVAVDVRIPAGIEVVDYEASSGRYAAGTWRVRAVPPKGEATLHLTVSVRCHAPQLLRAQLQ